MCIHDCSLTLLLSPSHPHLARAHSIPMEYVPLLPRSELVCLPIFTLLDIIIRVDQIRDRLIKHPEVFTVQVINKRHFEHGRMWRETDTETAAEVIRQRLGFMYMLSAGHPSNLTFDRILLQKSKLKGSDSIVSNIITLTFSSKLDEIIPIIKPHKYAVRITFKTDLLLATSSDMTSKTEKLQNHF